MTPQERKVMELAFEALRMADELFDERGINFKEYGLEFDKDIRVKYRDAITAIKEALAQPEQICGFDVVIDELMPFDTFKLAQPKEPEQEPVACEHKVHSVDPATGNGHCLACFARGKMRFVVDEAPQRKPLTDEQARAEFEAWHKSAYSQPLERYGHTYKNMHVRNRWQGWLAAHGIKE